MAEVFRPKFHATWLCSSIYTCLCTVHVTFTKSSIILWFRKPHSIYTSILKSTFSRCDQTVSFKMLSHDYRTQLHLWKGGKGKWNSLNDNCWKERRYGERWWIREKEICAITNDMKLVKFNTWRNAGRVHSCLLFDSLHDRHGKASIHFSVFWPSPTPPHWRIQKYLLHPTLPRKPSPGAYPEIYIFALNLPSHPCKVVYP